MNALLAVGLPGAAEWLVIVLLMTLTVVVPVLIIMWIIRKLIANDRENRRLRLEVSKLAHEVEEQRKQDPGNGVDDASG
jgi:Flp pilus assembly protein TadB